MNRKLPFKLKQEMIKKDKNKITPLVSSLSGIIDLSEGFDPKKGYSNYLNNKYN